MAKVYLFLADGFEDIEALTVVDLMRRAGISIQTVAIGEEKKVETSHGITLFADSVFAECDFSDLDLLVLPGGQPGTRHLSEHQGLCQLLKETAKEGKRIAAICAAPTVLAGLGLLDGRRATSYPGVRSQIEGVCTYLEDPVVVDGNVTTSRGLGTAIDFSLCLIAQLMGQEKADEIAKSIVYQA